MDRLEAMAMFLKAVDEGSLSAAAREMGVPTPTLSRKVADLEARLGAQLLTRTTRKLALTDAGITYAAEARRILEQVEDAERQVAGEFTTPKGELVVTAPTFFGRLHVLPVVADFLERYPEVDVKLALGDRVVDLIDNQIDMAVRIGELPDSGLIATRIGTMRSVVCASPAFLDRYGVPQTPADLEGLPFLATPLQAATLTRRPRLIAPAEAMIEAAIRGIGFARPRHYQAAAAIEAGTLRLLLESFEPEPAPIHLIHAPRGQMPLKMRRFLDFAAPRLRASCAGTGR